MKAILYYVSLPLIYFISILPYWWLYRFSDLLFIIVYHIIGYRKKIVITNLKNAFPEKEDRELRRIQFEFYQYFCDLIVETLKSLTISSYSLRKRITFRDKEVFQKYYDQNQSILIVMGHWGNWELGGARFAIEPLHKLYVVYHPLHNKYFNQLVYKMRTRMGNGLYSMKDTLRCMIRDKGKLTATAFIADQTPSPKGAYWTTFLNQDTPVFTGPGKIARKFGYPVVYVSIRRKQRGQYEVIHEDLINDPSNTEANIIVERFMKRLELDIQKMPEAWLWTHRRWKHQRDRSNRY